MVPKASVNIISTNLGVFKAFGKGYDIGKKHLFKLSDEEIKPSRQRIKLKS